MATVEEQEGSRGAPVPSPSTPVRKRYPTVLSRGSENSAVHRRGPSSTRKYETLDELLTAAGYTETRIVTPNAERLRRERLLSDVKESPTGEGAPHASANNASTIGDYIHGFLSAWMPGASVSLGRANGAQIARRDAIVQGHKQEEDSAHSVSNAEPPVSSSAAALRKRPGLPLDFIGNQQPQPVVRQSAAFPASNVPASTAMLHLRHAASLPHLQRPLRRNPTSSSLSVAKALPVARDRPNASKRLPTHLRPAAASRPPSRISRRIRSAREMPPAGHSTPLAPVLRTEEVLCHSAPASRSSSRVRLNHADAPPLPPLLSPTLIDSMLMAHSHDVPVLPKQRQLILLESDHDTHDESDSGPEEVGLSRLVFSRLSRPNSTGEASLARPTMVRLSSPGRISPAGPVRRSTTPSRSTPSNLSPSASATSSTQFLDTPDHDPSPVLLRTQSSEASIGSHNSDPNTVARRQRSIQSLRAHLAIPDASVTSKLRKRPSFRTPLSFSSTPTANAEDEFLDGPEWDGAMYRRNKRTKGKAFIPWFGGERAFLNGGGRGKHHSSLSHEDVDE